MPRLRQPPQFSALRQALADSTAASTDLPNLRATIAQGFRDATSANTVVLCEARPDGSVLEALTSAGVRQDVSTLRFSTSGRLAGWLETNECGLVPAEHEEVCEYLTPEERTSLSDHDVRGCLPVMAGDRLLALLCFVDPRPEWRVPHETEALECAQLAGAALDASFRQDRKYEQLRTLHRAQQLVAAGQVAATVAHEVRNPLAAVRSTIQYVMTSESPLAQKLELLGETLGEIDRIDHTVSGILNLSRPERLALVHADLHQIAESAVTLVQAYADARGVDIRVSPSPALPVIGDIRELRQVFLNLLLNACEAMPEGGQLQISSSAFVPDADGADGRSATVQITDTGPGIAADVLGKIYDPFFTTKSEGSGLGLCVCLEIVNRHGGRLDLRCPSEGGTVATVALPWATPQ